MIRKIRFILFLLVVCAVSAPLGARLLHLGVQGSAVSTQPSGPGPLAEWLLTSPNISGTAVTDVTGNGNTGTIVNGPLTFVPEGSFSGTQYMDSSLVVGDLQVISSITAFTASTTFAAATANATVGTVSVTMSPAAPGFAGTLSITGANSCGFHLSGTTVQAGAGGCSATAGPHSNGLYDDWNVVAAQSGLTSKTQAEAATAIGGGGGQVCVSGPNFTGTLPADLTTAGMTSCLINADFNDSRYNNPSTWIDGCGGPTSGLRWVVRLTNGQGCNRFHMEFDSSVGKQVVHIGWLASDGDIMKFIYPQDIYVNQNPGFPMGVYYETTFRLTSSSMSGSGVPYNFWVGGGPGHTTWIEPDMLEIQSNTCGSGNSCVWGDGGLEHCTAPHPDICNGINPSTGNPMDLTVYHKIGTLWTTDGSSVLWKCTYVDGTKQACGSMFPVYGSNLTSQHDNYMLNWFGDGTSQNVDVYIQSNVAFACPGSLGTTTQCPGPLITH